MLDTIFDLNCFNVIEDKENYYFFRALKQNDIINRKFEEKEQLKPNREKNEVKSLYDEDDKISLEEVHDHIKWCHRKDTNCISLTTNANIALTYNRGNNNTQYAMITVPKNKFNNSNFYIAGQFFIKEINNRIEELVTKSLLDETKVKFLKMINDATSTSELFSVLEQYTAATNSTFNASKYYDFYALDDKQNLEKNKLIAKLDVIDRRLLSRCNNQLLMESVKFAFASSEIIHYKKIEENVQVINPIFVDLFALIQQAKSMGMNKEKIKLLECKIIEHSKKNMTFENGKLGDFETVINDYIQPNTTLKISDIFKLTNGRVPFSKAQKALEFGQNLANSKIRASNLCDLLKEIADDSYFNSIIEEIKQNCYVVSTKIASRINQDGIRLSDSVCLSMNVDGKPIFSKDEQLSILEFIKSLDEKQKINFIRNNGMENEIILNELLQESYIEEPNLNRYYAETIIDYLNLDDIYKMTYSKRILNKKDKDTLVSYLGKANCINMFDTLVDMGFDYSEVSGIIFNLLLSNGFDGFNYIDLSNSSEFRRIMTENKYNLSSRVSAIRLEHLLGIKDNNNYVPTTNINLRDYQKYTVDRVDKIFETKNFAGVVLPTGAGKSFVAIAQMLKYKNQNVIYYAPNREILRQLQKHILKYVLNKNVIPESEENYYLSHISEVPEGCVFQKDIEEIIKIAFPNLNMYCYQGLVTKEDEFFKTRNAGLVILDEVHRTGAQEWNEKIKILIKNNPKAKILGITATPIRDVDNQNMVEKIAEFSGSYTSEEIKKKEYLAAEMYLIDAMQDGIVVTPNIVTFDYTLEDSEYFKEIKRLYEQETNLYIKEDLKKTYDSMRKIIESSEKKGMPEIIKEGFEKNNKAFNGRYIVFLPTNTNSELSTEEYMLQEIEKIKDYFKEIDPNPDIEYLLSDRKSKSENINAINRFESEGDHLKLIFAINMLNEGVHVDGIDGIIMLRPLSAGSKILYYQQIGRCIYSLDPNHELEPSEFPIIFDVYNNYLEQNMDRQVNRHTITSDLQKLCLIRDWITRHNRYPDINSESLAEARKAFTLKRIQKKYSKYLDNPSYSSNLNDTEIFEIENIISIGKEIELWYVEIPERVLDDKESDLEQFSTFKLKGEQKEFIDLFRHGSKLVVDDNKKSKELRLIDTLNILDILAEYNVDINNTTIPMDSILQNIYSKIPIDVLGFVQKEINLDVGFRLGNEYNEVKKAFYRKNDVFLDYDIQTLRKMGIFEPCNMYKGFENIQITNQEGFIIHGPIKFLNLNIYTGTYFSPKGININGLDKKNFSEKDEFFNKYNFGRDGYYYEVTASGEYIKTDSIYNPYGFDIKGDYYHRQSDGTYVKQGKINSYGFDIDGYYYKYNSVSKTYVKTDSVLDERGFNIDGIYCCSGEYIGPKTKEVEYNDYITRTFENIRYLSIYSKADKNGHLKVNKKSKFITDLPYDTKYFDRDGYYYTLDENGNRIKSNLKYNERYLDVDSYYYDLQPDGTRRKTNRKYDDNFYDLDGYYYELQSDGTRKKTSNLNNNRGMNYMGLNIKYSLDSYNSRRVKFMAFDKDGFCYEFVKYKFIKMDPPSKISRYGFDADGYYHELLPDGTRKQTASGNRFDENGFDECGLYNGTSIRNKYGFSQDGYYWKNKNDLVKTNSKTDDNGFDIKGNFCHKNASGEITYRKYNKRYLDRNGYYYKKTQDENCNFFRVKTNRKVDIRGFDLSGKHYDVQKNTKTGEYVYSNPKKYDRYGFDLEGIYYEEPKIFYSAGGSRNLNLERIRSNPPRIYNDFQFNCYGFYCEIENGKVTVTNSIYNPYGFDINGYYKELDAEGKKTIFDENGFTIEGRYSIVNSDGTRTITESLCDEKGFTQKDYLDYKNGKIKYNENGFDCMGDYWQLQDNNTYKKIGKINPRGFDINGYYYELLPDGARNTVNTGKKINSRGFDIDGYYHQKLSNGSREEKPSSNIYDERGFDIDYMFILSSEKRPYDSRYFGYDEYYYEKKDNEYIKTNRKFDDNGFDLHGNYWKCINGKYVNTNQKYDDNGYEHHGFNKKGIHKVTKLKYDENYFNKDGMNIITNTPYSLTGYDIDGRFFKRRVSSYAIYHNSNNDEELSCASIADAALNLPADKWDLYLFEYLKSIKSGSVDKQSLYKFLYENIIAAAVLVPKIKDKLIKYIKDLTIEIEKLNTELENEKKKAVINEKLIENYSNKITKYKDIIRKTSVGGKNGRYL